MILNKSLMVSRLVAENFVEKESDIDDHVIHLDFDNSNDYYKNLKWVNYDDRLVHYKKNPNVIKARLKALESKKKLAEASLRLIRLLE